MKSVTRQARKSKPNLKSQSFSLSNAKTYLGRLMEKAGRGEVVYIVRGERRFILQEVPRIDPIPMRPDGYFDNSYTKAELREQNQLAKASIVRPPVDLE